MFKTGSPKGAATRAHVLQVALALFRDKGVDNTTMREIATRASLSLGAAYHYFASKEAIILAYYADVQRQHVELARQALVTTSDLRDRLAVAMHTKLDVLGNDRRIMGALLRYTGDPAHPLSFLGATSRPIQLASIAVFDEALADTPMPAELRRIAPTVLWALHMGILLYFLYDDSPNQTRTRRLVDGAMEFVVRMMPVMRFPLFKPVRSRLASLLDEAGLVLDPQDVPPLPSSDPTSAGDRSENQPSNPETEG
jgi:AcrR family transcriptional regulator